MEKDLIFFIDGTLTDTAANRIAEFARLAYTDIEFELNSISFVNKKIETINGTMSKDISFGIDDVSFITDKVNRIGDLKSLCAWLREAIAAHQRLINGVKEISFAKYLENNGIVLPEKPTRLVPLSENDVVADFDIKKRNRYYSLEAHAATIGQFIHKGGSIDIARKDFYEKLSKPRLTSGQGSDTIIYSYEPSVVKGDVEKLFYNLQQMHATYQSELNAIKSEIKSRITNDTIDKNKKYEEEYKAYSEEEKKAYNQYIKWQSEELKRVSALKIVIPNKLKSIFDEIANKGKI